MNDPLRKIKPAVRAISAYTLPPYRANIKINQNENPFDVPEPIKEEVARRLQSRPWSRYSAFVPASLLERLASFAGWKPEGTLAGNGSNELIQAVLTVTVAEKTRVVIPQPTFTLYRQIVTVLGGEAVSIPLTSDFQFDVPALLSASRTADVVVICSPNNPTGCRIDDEDICRIATEFDGILVLDEAYHEFSGHSVVRLLDKLPNLVVLRTFSKAMAMAGLRIGYMLSSPEITREVHKATLPYNLNFYSAAAAETACEMFELLRPGIELIIQERERLIRLLASIKGLEVFPSSANFILIRSSLEASVLFEELHKQDILVRDVSRYPMLSRCVRVSVGSPEENDRLADALSRLLSDRL